MTEYYYLSVIDAGKDTRDLLMKKEVYSQELSTAWSCNKFLSEKNGQRLFEEIIRRADEKASQQNCNLSAIGITMPGAIQSSKCITRSSRLNIFTPFDLSDFHAGKTSPEIFFLHDMECIARGEYRRLFNEDKDRSLDLDHCLTFIFVDEGIGSITIMNGRPLKGAGFAGPLGRLIVEPSGTFNPQFNSRGPLEMYSARPWVSINMVNRLMTEVGKNGEETVGNQAFRRALRALADGENRKSDLQYDVIKLGLDANDPIAVTVLDDASRYLGLVISHIITLLNPHQIILSGKMIVNVPEFFEKVVWNARRYSWGNAWNTTEIKRSEMGRDAQILGAYELMNELCAKQE